MKKPRVQMFLAVALVLSLLSLGTWPATALDASPVETGAVYLRLKYATFDPLASLPDVPANQQIDAYPADGTGLYIVQFEGPVQEEWKDQLRALGARLLDYLPDYAFLVWMNASVRAQVDDLPPVRWTGIYQPAYKISPSYDGAPMVRVSLVEGADLAAVQDELASIDLASTRVTAKQFTAFVPDGDVQALTALPEVLWIEERPIYQLHNDVGTAIMGGAQAWATGLNGSGMMVTVADTGIDTGTDSSTPGDMHADFDNRMAAITSWPMISDDGCSGCCIANLGADDGADDVYSGHGTHVLGSVGGNGAASGGQIRGLAYASALTFQAVEQYVDFTPFCETNPPYYTDGYYLLGLPDDISALFQQAYDWGSRIHSNSWGSEFAGEYTVDSRSVDNFVWTHPDMTILFSAGNWGVDANWDGFVDQDSLGSPGTAKNAITTGASDNERDSGGYNPGGVCSTWFGCWGSTYPVNPTRDDRISDTRQELAAFSSRGPTNDGRIKPDLVAPGTNILSTRSSLAILDGWGSYTNPAYMYMGGTSMANPLLAGAATLVREYYVEQKGHNPSAALVKATLINSATDIGGYGVSTQEAGLPIPNNHEGWGLANVAAATSGQRLFYDGDTVSTGIAKPYPVQIGASGTPFKISLVWSDYPAGVSAATTLVNNLNLVVIGPGGVTYRGNNYGGGWSIPGGTSDAVNNVESVYIANPASGSWSVRVEGANVPQGPQPYAVVMTGYFGAAPVYDTHIYLPLVLRNFGTPPTPTPSPTTPPVSGWVTILGDDFEGAFPGAWDVFDDDGGSYGEYYWAKRNCRAFSGSNSAWAVGGGAHGGSLSCGSNYPNDAISWMVYGPFSLADASNAYVTFKLWANLEDVWDGLFYGASLNGANFYGSSVTGYTGGWSDRTLDLTNVYTLGNLTGQSQVWIAFVLDTDSTITYPEGAYVDDVVLNKYVGAAAAAARPLPLTTPAAGGANVIETPATRTINR